MSQIFETQFGGRTLTIETGKLARLAGGSVTVRYGDTMVLGTANRSDPRPGLDFFPLTVDFEERMYAAGKIPGGFIKREARPSESGDPRGSTDRPTDPAALPRGLQGRHPARHHGPLDRPGERSRRHRHGRRIGGADDQRDPVPRPGRRGARGSDRRRVRRQPDLQPARASRSSTSIVSGTRDAIMMVEAGAKLLPEDVMAEAILFGHRSLQPLDRPPGGAPEGGRQGQAHPVHRAADRARSSTSSLRPRTGRELVVIDVETTGTDPKMSRSARDRRGQGRRARVIDRWSTLVNPGRPIVGNQMHGITDADVAGAPSPARGRQQALDLHRRRDRRRPQRRVRPRLPRGRAGDGASFEPGRYLDTLVIAREGYPEIAARTSSRTCRRSSGST